MNANQTAVIDFVKAMEKEGRARVPKPPTRLQKQAPATLQLDQITSFSFSSCPATSMAIPLLSPLPLSPQPVSFPDIVEKRKSEIGGGDSDQRIKSLPSGGWKHPAVATFADPSTLFTFFQSQCIVTSNTP